LIVALCSNFANAAKQPLPPELQPLKLKLKIERMKKSEAADQKIRHITVDEFEKTVLTDDENLWIVFYGSKKCPHTQKFNPKWLQFQENMDNGLYNFDKIKIVKVECYGEQFDFCVARGNQFWPELMFYYKGVKKASYEGEDEIEDIVKFIKEKKNSFMEGAGNVINKIQNKSDIPTDNPTKVPTPSNNPTKRPPPQAPSKKPPEAVVEVKAPEKVEEVKEEVNAPEKVEEIKEDNDIYEDDTNNKDSNEIKEDNDIYEDDTNNKDSNEIKENNDIYEDDANNKNNNAIDDEIDNSIDDKNSELNNSIEDDDIRAKPIQNEEKIEEIQTSSSSNTYILTLGGCCACVIGFIFAKKRFRGQGYLKVGGNERTAQMKYKYDKHIV